MTDDATWMTPVNKRLEKWYAPLKARVSAYRIPDRWYTMSVEPDYHPALRLTLQIFEINPEEIADAFRLIDKERPDALIVQQNLSFTPHLRQIADLAIGHRLATVHPTREFVEAGGLLAYGPSIFALGERAAWYTDRILKGMKPADLRATD